MTRKYYVKALYNEDDQPLVGGPFDTEEEALDYLNKRARYAGEPQTVVELGG